MRNSSATIADFFMEKNNCDRQLIEQLADFAAVIIDIAEQSDYSRDGPDTS